MKITSILLTIYSFILIFSLIHAKTKKGPQCSTCKEIVSNFAKGLEATKKSNYGGGNTDWEESRLGNYANSEVRLVEIMDNLCSGASKECHQVLEEYEALIEDFWFHSEIKDLSENEFYEFLCISKMKACCPNNTYGPLCKECPGGKERPCKDNGQCKGAGTREGSGKCKCNQGYQGQLCDGCTSGYYEDHKNDTHTICKVCHIACKTSCTGDGPAQCDECKDGWTSHEETGCQDINECDNNPCKETEYCINTQGSYSCLGCNVACDGCTGSGSDKCLECNDGYQKEGDRCLDLNECTAAGNLGLCSLEGQQCENTVGSYKCGCKSGYVKDGTFCKPIVKDKPKTEEKKSHRQSNSNLNRREESLITLLFAFFALSVIFFVIGKLCYLINPYLLSVPVGVFSIIVYYMIKEGSDTDDGEKDDVDDADNTPKPDQAVSDEDQKGDKETSDTPKEEL